MKKTLSLIVGSLLILVLAACGSSDGDSDELVVGATSVPHSEVLEEAKPLLEEEGINLKIETYQDYVLPNKDLDSGEIDANYFQHIPYLEEQKAQNDFDFVNLGGIHIEPMGIYSKNIKSLEEIPEGTTVLMSRSVADHGRVLSLLEREGIIKLEEGVDKVTATVDDIVENPKNLKFDAGIDAALLPSNYEREENALVAINTNYAIEADLNPTEDSLILEGPESPYVNVIAARSEDEDNEQLKKLVEVLRSEKIQNFIKEEYNGAVVPAGGSEE
ncbi:MetQ/NlpA family ABC transporter substrate-binding protein [Thalassobacillus hwangdonensis]|uniref:Lipoprotein n=1 Tax=Thalassobacillus hwangdonensis TaxID=546108 RepID=A0ABW3L5R6_9BACI